MTVHFAQIGKLEVVIYATISKIWYELAETVFTFVAKLVALDLSCKKWCVSAASPSKLSLSLFPQIIAPPNPFISAAFLAGSVYSSAHHLSCCP